MGFTLIWIKATEKGQFEKLALNNLNPSNPSNKLYFEEIGRDLEMERLKSEITKLKNYKKWREGRDETDCTYGKDNMG